MKKLKVKIYPKANCPIVLLSALLNFLTPDSEPRAKLFQSDLRSLKLGQSLPITHSPPSVQYPEPMETGPFGCLGLSVVLGFVGIFGYALRGGWVLRAGVVLLVVCGFLGTGKAPASGCVISVWDGSCGHLAEDV